MSQPRSFPPDVFARLAPEVYFKRHLEQGIRPTGRGFEEFRPVHIQKSNRSELVKGALGAAVVRAGEATIMCGINGGLTDFEGEGGIFANVEIQRGGRSGAPTPEEMVLSQRVHKLIQAAAFDHEANFKIQVDNSITPVYKELVLNASIRVLSRTGPSLDLVWQCLVAALQDTLIPGFMVDEKTQKVVPDFTKTRALEFPEGFAICHSTFGLINNLVLADPDGPTEESCVPSYASVAKNSDGTLSGFSISSAHADITLDTISQVLAAAGSRPLHE